VAADVTAQAMRTLLAEALAALSAGDRDVLLLRVPAALLAGFDWYRAFPRDADENICPHNPIGTPVLCVRGDGERGDVEAYANGLRASGAVNVFTAVIVDAGHFTQEEQPERTWIAIAAFAFGA